MVRGTTTGSEAEPRVIRRERNCPIFFLAVRVGWVCRISKKRH